MELDIRYTMLHAHSHSFLGVATIVTSMFAFTTLPSFIPLVLQLSILLFYVPQLVSNHRTKLFSLWIGLLLIKSYHWLGPSLNALSTPFTSIVVLLAHEAITSFVGLMLVVAYARSRTRIEGVPLCSRVLLFPAVWTTAWWAISLLSPVGYLTAWSPVIGFQAYNWLIPVFGSPIRDWLVGAWALVVSEVAEAWYMGSETPDEAPLLVQAPNTSTASPKRHSFGSLSLGVVLLALTVPSYVWPSDFPRSPSASDSTPLEVGCVLPQTGYKLQDYINATDQLASSAKVVLWPEGAVTFANETERDDAFVKIIGGRGQFYVGVAFEEAYPDPADPSGRQSLFRTGLALVSLNTEPHLIYYKRNLVPVAESYRLQKSDNPPPLVTLDIPITPKWAAGRPKKRPVSVSASICLDFAVPDAFSGLESKPDLILAPARTWDPSVGHVMWEQAKQRARELDSMVLWCDGGEGGVSGVGGKGIDEVMQVGRGSWFRRIGIEYPTNPTQRTLYAKMGGSSATIGILWILLIVDVGLRFVLGRARGPLNVFLSLRTNLENWRGRRYARQEQEPNLLMD